MQHAVQHSFSSAAATYERPGTIQPQVAQRLAVDFLPATVTGDGRLLEIGSGTGVLTGLLRERYPQRRVLALDLAQAMAAHAQARFQHDPAVETMHADILRHHTSELFPLIASSSALHWIQDLPALFAHVAALLTPGGTLVCALMTAGTLCELRQIRHHVAPKKTSRRHLPEPAAVTAAVTAAGLRVERAEFEQHQLACGSARDLLKTLQAQGVAAGFYDSATVLNRRELHAFMYEFDRLYTNVTWDVLYLVASKKSS